ncbi:MAG: T9SS type A sorting domain-containing protein, partial [Chitinophagales bacterium]
AILGETLSSNGQVTDYQGQGDLWLIKIAEDGSLIWQKTLGSDIIETAYNVLQLQSGDLVALGTSFSLAQPSTLSDVILYKVEAQNGELIWDYQISGSGDDVGNGLTLASTGGFCFAGHTDSTDGDIGEGGKVHGSHKAWILQVDDGSTNVEGWEQIPFMEVQVFPNPITGNQNQISIKLKERKIEQLQFSLFNVLGEELEVKNIDFDKQNGVVVLEVANWRSGLYFLVLEGKSGVLIREKLVVD